jgi:GT2 family glycosyltransferase
MSKKLTNKILITLVTYKQSYINTVAYQSITRNVEQLKNIEMSLFIYDNSPYSSEAPNLLGINQIYRHDATNPGVSKAYNCGFQYAKELGYDWVILMDQDTILTNSGLNEYLKSINNFPDILIHAPILKSGETIISPSLYKFRRGFPIKTIEPGIKQLGKISPLNSGMCINAKVFNEMGVYNEKIRLDFSDFDFIRRVAGKVKRFVLMPVVFSHSLSSEDETFESAAMRYKFYCNGAYHSIINSFDNYILGIVVFLRGFKLSVKFKKLIFFKVFYKFYVLKNEIND